MTRNNTTCSRIGDIAALAAHVALKRAVPVVVTGPAGPLLAVARTVGPLVVRTVAREACRRSRG